MYSNILRLIQNQLPGLSDEGDEQHGHVNSGPRKTLRKASIVAYTCLLLGIIGWEAMQVASPNGSTGRVVYVRLTRGPFPLLDFAQHPKRRPHAIILFGSGDGGWSVFEDSVCRSLQNRGYEAIGIDFNRYAKTDYNLEVLQADMNKIALAMRDRFARQEPPIIMAGYSMGAAQAIAAAGGPHPPTGLIGVLLVDPCSRGRYGLRLTDQADILPTGPGTFSMNEFTHTMGRARVVQWHATEDPIDSRSWLQKLTAPHKEFDFGQTGHFYNNDRDDFLTEFCDSVSWIVASPGTAVTASAKP